MKTVKISPVPELGSRVIEWFSPEEILVSDGPRLLWHKDLASPPIRQWTFPQPWLRKQASRFRPCQRLLRDFYYHCIPLADDCTFVSFARQSGVLKGNQYQALGGGHGAFRVLRGGAALDPSGDLFFGQYTLNSERSPVHVYRLPSGQTNLEVVHVFAPGEIRHVHGVFRDPYTGDLWCLTGDRSDECRIIKTHNQFRTIEVVGQGDESWRGVSVQFTPTAIYYATDAEFERNALYRIDRTSGARTLVTELDGPVYYSTALGEHLFFAVTAELCPSQVGREASLWCVGDEVPVRKLWSAEKDRLSPKYFLRGMLHFSQGGGVQDSAYFHAVGLTNCDNRSFEIKLGSA